MIVLALQSSIAPGAAKQVVSLSPGRVGSSPASCMKSWQRRPFRSC